MVTSLAARGRMEGPQARMILPGSDSTAPPPGFADGGSEGTAGKSRSSKATAFRLPIPGYVKLGLSSRPSRGFLLNLEGRLSFNLGRTPAAKARVRVASALPLNTDRPTIVTKNRASPSRHGIVAHAADQVSSAATLDSFGTPVAYDRISRGGHWLFEILCCCKVTRSNVTLNS
jgi:hypothetical protein